MISIAWNQNIQSALSGADRLMGRLAGNLDRMQEPEIRHLLLARETAAVCEEDLGALFRCRAEGDEGARLITAAGNTFHKAVGMAGETSSFTANQLAALHVLLHEDPAYERRAASRFGEAAEHLSKEEPFLMRSGLMLCQTTLLETEIPGAQRTGQLVFTALSVSESVVPWPGLGISAFLNATRADHVKLCRTAEKGGDSERWMLYFLNGVARQCEDSISRLTRIEELIQKWKQAVSAPRHAMALRLLTALAANPFLTVKGAAAHLDAAFTTAQRAVDKLLELGILQETTNQRRDRMFCAEEIVAILNEPPRVMSVSPWREKEIIPDLPLPEEPEFTRTRHDPSAKLPIPY